MKASAIVLYLAKPFVSALVWEDGTGKLPAMGWNSWNTYLCDINATLFIQQAQAMLDHRLQVHTSTSHRTLQDTDVLFIAVQEAGYEYVNLDDCWSLMSGRDARTKQLVPDPNKFPEGIAGLADQIHAMGFKLGIYSSAGTETCAGYPASIGYESIDAASWAAWGVDCRRFQDTSHCIARIDSEYR